MHSLIPSSIVSTSIKLEIQKIRKANATLLQEQERYQQQKPGNNIQRIYAPCNILHIQIIRVQIFKSEPFSA